MHIKLTFQWTLFLLLAILGTACGGRGSAESGRAAGDCGPATSAPLLSGELLETGNRTLDLWNQGHRRPVVCNSDPSSYFQHPAFAPDGRRFAYVLSAPPTRAGQDWGDDIYVADLDGSNGRKVLGHEAQGMLVTSLAWSADGSALIYGTFRAVYDTAGQFTTAVYQVKRLTLQDGSVSLLLDKASQASPSRDGKRLVYVAYPTNNLDRNALAIANIDGSDAHIILANQLGFQDYYAPHLSPDGQRLAFAAVGGPVGNAPVTPALARRWSPNDPVGRLREALTLPVAAAPVLADGSPYTVWIVNLDGSDLHPAANLREDVPFPLWSADGKQILFLGAGALYLANADGSDVRQIDKGVAHGQIAWSQPGQH